MRLPPADAALVALSALITGCLVRGSIGALVSHPSWVMIAVGAVCAVAGVSKKDQRQRRRPVAACIWVTAWLAAGLTLPADLPPPRSLVSTHALGGGAGIFTSSPAAHSDLFALLETLDEDPRPLLGQRVTVAGAWGAPGSSPASVSERIMACCAADAVDVGFDVLPARAVNVASRTRVHVSGVVRAVLREGELRYRLEDATVTVFSAGNTAAR